MLKRGIWIAVLFLLGSAGLVGRLRAQAEPDADHDVYLPLVQRPSLPGNLSVTTATYLGGVGDDQVLGVDIAPDGTIAVAAILPGHEPGGVTPTTLLDGGDGALLRLAADGQSVLSTTRLGETVWDLTAGEDGRFLVCGTFGVALLDNTAASLIWHEDPGTVTRCDYGPAGTAVALHPISDAPDEVYIYDGEGATWGTWQSSSAAQHVADVAAVPNRIILTGYTQKLYNLQVPFITAWSHDGLTRHWTAYDFTAGAISGQNLDADSEGVRVALGEDGQLYFAAKTDGGNNVFTRNPGDVTETLPGSTLIQFDAYNTPYQLNGAPNFTFYGRFDPASGELDKAQFLLVRLSNGNGNTIIPYAIDADANGRLYLTGQSYASIENRDEHYVNEQPVGPYSSGEPFLLVAAPDWGRRIVWMPWAGLSGAGSSSATAVGVRGETAVIGVALDADADQITTPNALQTGKSAGAEGYLALWPQSGEE